MGAVLWICILIYAYLAYRLLKLLVGPTTSRRDRLVIMFVFGSILVLIPTWDVLWGRIYLSYLCSTAAGMKVYKSVPLEKKYFKENGDLDFQYTPGKPQILAERYM